jgi:hypothetical protein
MAPAAVDRIIAALKHVTHNYQGYMARCPAHDDSTASLSVREGDDGRVLVKCFAGCSVEQIVAALGLSLADLFEQGNGSGERGTTIPPHNHATVQPPSGCTLAQYAEVKKLPVGFLQSLGLSDINYLGSPAIRIPYLDEGGSEAAIRFRVALAKSEHEDNRFRWKSGAKPCLYGLWRLDRAKAAGYLVLVEGESDCHTLWLHDIPALGIPGASNWREARDAHHLDGIETIYLVVERDRGGETVKKWLASSHIRDRVRLVDLEEYKDPSALYLSDPNRFRAQWQAVLERAVPWREREAEEADAQRREAWNRCRDLARMPCILDRFAHDLVRCGLVGEDRAAKLLYLVLTSRCLKRPVSAAIKGPSSGGKSYLVERVLSFFPSSGYHALSAMSERALAYSQEPLAHRFLVVFEAAGLQGDFASYLVRSLLSEGRVRYETVEKTRDGLRPRLIEREGPTGLLVTTTAVRLHPENETRLLSIPVTDTPEQTKHVLLALADEANGAVDVAPWHALQTWLEESENRVTVPYAPMLAHQIPPVAVRLRRDFGAILSLIHAHALLHQATRMRDAERRIVATLDDYAGVRELVADLLADGLEATVSPTIRETVNAVQDLITAGAYEVTVAQVARRLHLDKGTALRRVRVAEERGYLKNLEERKGRPARLVLGDLLPEDEQLLPPPDELEGCSGCTVAVQTEGMEIPPSPAPIEEEGIWMR